MNERVQVLKVEIVLIKKENTLREIWNDTFRN